MAEFRYFDAEIAEEIARVISTNLGNDLGLVTCEAGDPSSLPAPSELRSALNAVFIHFVDVDTDDVLDKMAPPGFEAVYEFEIVYLRKQLADENSDSEVARDAGRIAALFLNGQRKLPGLKQPGCRVWRCVPVKRSGENAYNDFFDVPRAPGQRLRDPLAGAHEDGAGVAGS